MRHDSNDSNTYSTAGRDPRNPGNIGHNLNDTMWSWNQDMNFPRPSFAPPRPVFPDSPQVDAPGQTPTVRDMIDYQSVTGNGSGNLNFDFDDVPFEL